MTTISAVETLYKSIRFRSRLEARWAIFFDELDIKWVYEPDPYKNEQMYLPDFWLTDSRTWIEVKPDMVKVSGTALDKSRDFYMSVLAHNGSNIADLRHYYILVGQPYIDEYEFIHPRFCSVEKDVSFVRCQSCGKYVIGHHVMSGKDGIWIPCSGCERISKISNDVDENIIKAYDAARMARWGHGEQPVAKVPVEYDARPLDPYDFSPLTKSVTCQLCSFDEGLLNKNVTLGGEVLSIDIFKDKRQLDMARVVIGDSTGFCNIVFFAKSFAYASSRLVQGQVIVVMGKASKYKDEMCLLGDAVQVISCQRIDPDDDPRALAKELGL